MSLTSGKLHAHAMHDLIHSFMIFIVLMRNIARIVSGHPTYLSRLCHVSCFPRVVAHHSSLQLQLAKSNDVM